MRLHQHLIRMAQGERRTVSSMAELLLEKAVEEAKRK
jgi:hypothetical protein